MSRTYRSPGLVLTEHEFGVPLDHSSPDGEQISVFVREIAAPDGLDRPYLLFLQGGPGFEAPRPEDRSGWVSRALEDFRVLMLDQRGTGRSTPVTRQTLAGRTPRQQADRLACFRADSIVADAEHIRTAMGVQKWSILGQSYGGFCATTYLSFHPESLREAFITGGIPGLHGGPDRVYRSTYPRVRRRVEEFYARYPGDREVVRALAERLEADDVRLPDGDRLTAARLRTLGGMLGHTGGFEQLHYLLERAWVGEEIDEVFLARVGNQTSFAENPIYALLHEACYAHGPGATRWSAQRVLAEHPEFAEDPTMLTGEMIYPRMYEEHGALAPLREAAELLAQREDWGALYDLERLRVNEVPAAAAAYTEDIYVPYDLQRETAASIPGLRLWSTSEYEHNGLRASGDRVIGRLIDMARGKA
jgi:pimeloyl-ACP methyl ester carboxylesterase